jgi:hypothetical protein
VLERIDASMIASLQANRDRVPERFGSARNTSGT